MYCTATGILRDPSPPSKAWCVAVEKSNCPSKRCVTEFFERQTWPCNNYGAPSPTPMADSKPCSAWGSLIASTCCLTRSLRPCHNGTPLTLQRPYGKLQRLWQGSRLQSASGWWTLWGEAGLFPAPLRQSSSDAHSMALSHCNHSNMVSTSKQ
jgi:hypothetical protein